MRHAIINKYAYIQDLRADRDALYESAAENNRQLLALGITGPLMLNAKLQLAEDLIETGRCEEGMNLLQEVADQTPPKEDFNGNIQVIQSKGCACLGDLDQAIRLVTASTFNGDMLDTKAYLNALYLYQADRKEEALRIIDQNIEKGPSFMGWRYYLRAAVYFDLGETDRAGQDLDAGAMYTWDRNGLYSYVHGKLALAAGDKDAGMEWLRHAEASLPVAANVLREQIVRELEDLSAEVPQATPTVSSAGLTIPAATKYAS